ncbi:HotDog domain-containing protein [Scheffersomyces xylosifermentans]|uniref:HotDog domain-containing protein n=1 Tax=Scheffersomyces xylosifermentans TaxID=1304137 RepID=UPI00315DA157
MFRRLVRTVTPLVAFGVGIAAFPAEWRKGNWRDKKILHINDSVLQQIQDSEIYKTLLADKNYTQYNTSHAFPDQHHKNYVATGLLFGPNLFEIDPIVFLSEKNGELTSFYHLGDQLISQDGQIHNGVISTILDEGLCSAGFPLLPSKKGVTASLSIDFKNQAPPGSTVVLRAKVLEAKGRKVVIEGTLETLPSSISEKSIKIAESKCILVEPKWFKYFSWFQII